MEEIYTIPCGTHKIRTTITAKAATVRRWIAFTKYIGRYFYRHRRLVVGLGVQWVLGERFAATLQLCVGHRCLIFQLHHANNCPLVLHRFLLDPKVIFVGLANFSDADMLMRSHHRLRVRQLVDVKEVARDRMGCDRGSSMGRLAEEILGMPGLEKDEEVGRSDWDDEYLSMDQVIYACHDVFLSFFMAKVLRVWNWVENNK